MSLQGGWYASRDACNVRELVAHIVVNLHLVEVLGMMVKTKGIKEGANEKSGRWTEVIMATWAPWLLSRCTRFAGRHDLTPQVFSLTPSTFYNLATYSSYTLFVHLI